MTFQVLIKKKQLAVFASCFFRKVEKFLMISLQPPLKYISKTLGEQKIKTGAEYRLLNFCEQINVEDGVLIYNNLSKELILLSEKELAVLQESDFRLPYDLALSLIKSWFLVPKEHDDIRLSDQLVQLKRLLKNDDCITDYNILTTTACNARCFYCYEAGSPVITMNKKIATDVADYIIHKSKGKQVHLNWFGGEPLCNLNAIDVICNRLSENNIIYYSTMVSNGYLFDEMVISKAVKSWNLRGVQITLDGLENTYNKVKNYINNDNNAFVRVMNNIHQLCQNNIGVQVRLNMDLHNSEELFKLSDKLTEFAGFANFSLYANLIYEDVGFDGIHHSDEEKIDLTQKFKKLCKYIDELGINQRAMLFNRFKCYACQADNPSWTMIMPNGNLGFCEHYIKDECYGNIYSDSPKSVWSEYVKPLKKCNSCVAYPTCIMLKKCPIAGNHNCYEYEQYNRIENIRRGMLKVYKNFKEGIAVKKNERTSSENC